VHASAVDPTPFLCCTPEYDRLLIVRHSDPWKWPACTVSMIPQIATRRQDAAFRVMGLHHDWAYRIKRALPSFEACVARRLPAWAFLDRASLFMYPVKPDYREQGPRTIVEAMAAGLPCIVDNRDGPSDRVTLETGWLMNRHADYAPMIARIAPAELREKGEAARERARTVFRPEDWADWIEEVATS
jgi:glycosyltransferase involved in cell wall biosynthesis